MKPATQTPIDEILKDMAVNIRAQRLLMHYSQEYLAYRLNISQNAYSKIELGATRITVERLLEIARILEVTITELLEQPVQAGFMNSFHQQPAGR